MSAVASFDTLQYAKKLEKVGLTPQQAEAHAEAIKELMDNKLATKEDLRHLEERLIHYIDQKIAELNTSVNEKIAELNTSVNGKIAELNTSVNGKIAELNTSVNGKIVEQNAVFNEKIDKINTTLTEKINRLERRIDKLENRIDQVDKRIDEMGYKLTIRLGSIMITGLVALSIIIKLF